MACRYCSNYIFTRNLIPSLNGLGKDNYITRRETFRSWDLVPLMLELRRYHLKEHIRVFECNHIDIYIIDIKSVGRLNPHWFAWWLVAVKRHLRNICHYSDVIMSMIASLITSLTIVYSTVYSDADQRKHQSPASLAFVRGVHRRPVNSTHKWPVTRKMFPFDDVIMVFLGQFPAPFIA